MPDAPPDAPGAATVQAVAAALVAPERTRLRRAALAALIASRDRNVLFILRQALRSTDPHIRQLACVGLGALGDPEALRDLAPMLGDAHRNVQLAAGLALGAIGTERALEIMVQGLLEGSDELRRAVAETLAAIPDGGHAILRDGILADDIMIRRANGLWPERRARLVALVALYRAMMEDEQCMSAPPPKKLYGGARAGAGWTARPPESRRAAVADRLGGGAREGVAAWLEARQVLIRALQDARASNGPWRQSRWGGWGPSGAQAALCRAARPQRRGRAAAFSALAEIQHRTGLPLPAVA